MPTTQPTAGEMNARGRCGSCGYGLLELARVSSAVQCPECGHWNARPAFLNFFPWPRPAALVCMLGWPSLVVALTLPLAALSVPRVLVGLYAMALTALCAAVPMVVAVRLVRVRCAPERQGRVMALLAAGGIAANLTVLFLILVIVVLVV
jgi:hypothetical protein